MNNREKLIELKNRVLDMKTNSVTSALFILLDHMVEADDSNMSYSDGDIGIDITNKTISIVDIEAGKELGSFTLKLN
jgi:hypothetical protein